MQHFVFVQLVKETFLAVQLTQSNQTKREYGSKNVIYPHN